MFVFFALATMASMASLLARAASSASAACRASRAAALASARAARSASAARRAAAAVSRAARSRTAAAADLALGTSSREARSLRCSASMNGRLHVPLGSDSSHIDSCLFPDDKLQTPVVDEAKEFVADEKDLESDEALWSLYERWCKHFNQERDRDEMARRFDYFKSTVLLVHQDNSSGEPPKLKINELTDGKLVEVYLGSNNACHREEVAKLAKLPKTGVGYIWLDEKFYMEVPEECQPYYA